VLRATAYGSAQKEKGLKGIQKKNGQTVAHRRTTRVDGKEGPKCFFRLKIKGRKEKKGQPLDHGKKQ